MVKINPSHIKLIESYLSPSRGYGQLFCINPIWLIKGKFYLEVIDDVLYLYKKSQIFGNSIFYHMGHPLTLDGNQTLESELTLALLDKGVDFSLSGSQLQYLNVPFAVYPSAKTGPEYLYHSDTYISLEGKNWKSWRQSIKKTQELLEVKIFTKKNLKNSYAAMKSILSAWKEHREKHVGQHAKWFIDNVDLLDDPMVMVFYLDGVPVSFNISHMVGDTVFFLDEKTVRHSLPNSFTISKAYHILCIQYWKKVSGLSSFWMTSGTGEKEYKLDDKTFDLDKHKLLLKPLAVEEVFKVRGKVNTEASRIHNNETSS